MTEAAPAEQKSNAFHLIRVSNKGFFPSYGACLLPQHRCVSLSLVHCYISLHTAEGAPFSPDVQGTSLTRPSPT